MRTNRFVWLAAVAALLTLAGSYQPLAASIQAVEQVGPKSQLLADKAEKSGFKWELELDAAAEFESNTFRLTTTQLDRMKRDKNVDQDNGRFVDMNTDYDIHFLLNVELMLEFEGLAKQRFRIIPFAGYDLYLLNFRKSHPDFGLAFEHTFTKHGRMRLEFDYIPGEFRRNYLVDAVNTGGSVSASQRDYDPGIRDGYGFDLDYRHTVFRTGGSKDSFGTIELTVSGHVGLHSYQYRGELKNRNQSGYEIGAAAEISFGRWLTLGIGHDFGWEGSPRGKEVFIVDEPDVGIDLDNDGDANDNNIRLFERVDRTNASHRTTFDVAVGLGADWSLPLRYRLTITDYTSGDSLDFSHRDRTDTTHDVKGGVQWKVSSLVRLELLGFFTQKTRNKGAVDTGDGSYTNFGGSFGIRLSF
mgnify:CR=1 FL=1